MHWRIPLIIALLATGCDGGPTDVPVPIAAGVLVVTTDYETGSFAVIDPDSLESFHSGVMLHKDAVCRTDPLFPFAFVIERLGADAVAVLDPGNGWRIAAEYSVGAGAGEVDLRPFADDDGNPEAGGLATRGDRAFVLLQRLDRDGGFAPADRGLIVPLTLEGDVEQAILLSGANPAVRPRYQTALERFVIVESGHFTVMQDEVLPDGGVELFDLTTGTLSGFVITAQALGGDIVDAVIASAQTGFAIIGVREGDVPTTRLVPFDPVAGTAGPALIVSPAWDLVSLELTPDNRELWVADRNFSAPGVRVFDVESKGERTVAPIDTGLPPFMICFFP